MIGPTEDQKNIGTVDNLKAGFSIHLSKPLPIAPPDLFSANGTADMNASISVKDFTSISANNVVYTVTEAKINASAKARAALDIQGWSDIGVPNPLIVDYNIGVAISAGFSISSEDETCLVGKYLITLDLSAKKIASIYFSDSSSFQNAIDLNVTIDVYNNDNVLHKSFVYTTTDFLSLISFSMPSEPVPTPEPIL